LGRSTRTTPPDAGDVGSLAEREGRDLLDAAAAALARQCRAELRHGRIEREVVAAAEGEDLLVVARDGDLRRLGPHSFNPATRFVVDHAPCAVLLVWPSAPPSVGSIPPPPRH
jgi:nucleotide-binding universal stress UspA family protein